MANAFNKGDVVVLKSGGPPLTVDDVPGTLIDGQRDELGNPVPPIERVVYLCRWFRGAHPMAGEFGEHLLVKFTPPATK